MKVALIGTGFVGVTAAVVYASFGNQVIGLDIDEKKIDKLNKGKVPFYEPKLTELLESGLESKKLKFTTSYKEAIEDADVVIVAVGTPSAADGAIDLSYIAKSVAQAAPFLKDGAVLAIKSTVLPGTLAQVKKIVNNLTDKKVYFAALPEFLKEGTAVDDTLYPDRIVIGTEHKAAFKILEELHAPFKAPILSVKPESAQLAKYASNNYLALRIVYANVLAEICENSEADIKEVIEAMGYEKRIGNHYWYPGLGYGGSCFPKDVKALAHFCQDNQLQSNLFAVINELNNKRPKQVLDKIGEVINGFQDKKVAVLGLSFKPNTDDQREAPALTVIPTLLAAGAKVVAYDPMVKQIANDELARNKNYKQVETIAVAVKEADLIIPLIEWSQIVGFDFATTKEKKEQYFFDARGQFEMDKMQDLGYIYLGIGQKF